MKHLFSARQKIKAEDENLCYTMLMSKVCENIIFVVAKANLLFVKCCFGANKELTILRICAPDKCRSTINFHTDIRVSSKPIQNTQVTSQDAIFWVLKVKVLRNTAESGISTTRLR